jgi:hypothetical protein
VTIEGYDPDKDMIINPALWKFVSTTTAIDPLTLETLYSEVTYEEDLRIYEGNGVFTARSNLPSE